MIKYYSTNQQAPEVSFRQALLKGLAPDRGLYMPTEIPVAGAEEIEKFTHIPYHEIAFQITRKFLGEEIDEEDLREITTDSYDYKVPLEPAYDKKYVMRLDQGPTASFKDFAARMMGRLMHYYLRQEKRKMVILTATSGDTGSAIANAFFGLSNIEVVVLFPDKEVTSRQRKQMTTLGKNVRVISVEGKFDDCQSLVKEAFSDPDLEKLHLSSANSINIGRLIPQIVYYFYAFARLRTGNPEDDVIFSVPSGNFGDMMGGVLAMKMGLPVRKFIISVNENDEFPRFLSSGKYEKIVPSKNCISSAMNVGHPSNLARLVALYGGVMDEKGGITRPPDMERMNKELYSVSISDAETRKSIRHAWDEHHLMLEPHGAVGWAGLQKFLSAEGQNYPVDQLYVSLETAHPAKFPEEIKRVLDTEPDLPLSLKGLEEKEEKYEKMKGDYKEIKKYLLENYGN